jgi:hypothetical protein
MKAFANGSSVQKSIKESIQNYRESKSTPNKYNSIFCTKIQSYIDDMSPRGPWCSAITRTTDKVTLSLHGKILQSEKALMEDSGK